MALWHYRWTMGDICGLRPAVTYWIYTIAHHMVVYAAIVWWHKIKLETSETGCLLIQELL